MTAVDLGIDWELGVLEVAALLAGSRKLLLESQSADSSDRLLEIQFVEAVESQSVEVVESQSAEVVGIPFAEEEIHRVFAPGIPWLGVEVLPQIQVAVAVGSWGAYLFASGIGSQAAPAAMAGP